MQTGHRYRVVYQIPGVHRYARASVLDFIAEDAEPEPQYVFSARPVAGTQELPKRWVLSVEPVDQTTPITIGDRA